MALKLTDIKELGGEHVKIKDPSGLEDKINKIINDGRSKLQVVTDFDCTLTKQKISSGKLLSSFGMFNECPSVPSSFKSEDRRLSDIYKPIENSPVLSIEYKTEKMAEWYSKGNEIMRGFPFPEEELKIVSKMVADNLRDGVDDMFSNLKEGDVPVLVFSAGLGDAVMSVLKTADVLTPNVVVISNFLKIDDSGIIDGMKGEIIHIFNKNETAIKNTVYYDMVKDRTNVIILGDSIGDARMADGMENIESVIKIGFLYVHPEEFLEKYMEHFDIVLIDDQTVSIPNAIIDLIIKNV